MLQTSFLLSKLMQKHMKYFVSIIKLISLLTVLSTAGCFHIGPAAMQSERIKYNVAIQNTDNQEMLLNLVRLRYVDVPQVLSVSNINSQLKIGADIESGVSITEGSSPPGLGDIYNFILRPSYEDKPTITYTPLQGDKFVKNVLSQVNDEVIMLLFNSGWSVKRVFSLCVQWINDIPNAPSASGPTPIHMPEYEKFDELLSLMRKMQIKNALFIGYKLHKDKPTLVMKFAKKALDWYEAKEIIKLLKLTPGKSSYPITLNSMDTNPEFINLQTRSLVGILFYLSHAVDVPENDIKDGRVTLTQDDTGNPFDWQDILGEVLKIKSDSWKPSDAYVSIKYRGKWFYIDDTDLTSKATFSLLTQVFAIQAGQIVIDKPTLTLPIGR